MKSQSAGLANPKPSPSEFMRNWLQARWKEYLESADPQVAMSASSPGLILFIVGSLSAIYLSLAFAPSLAQLSSFDHVWWCIGLAAVAGWLSITAWRHGCKGPIGSVATLLDNAFYSMSMALAAMSTRGNVAIALALVHGIMLAVFPGQLYAFSVPLAVIMLVPILAMLVMLEPALPVALITVSSTLAMLVFSQMTRTRRRMALRSRKIEQALDAANRVADESVQAALATTLLSLGHFLHELRNYQTAIATNLDYIKLEAGLGGESARALEEAQDSQREQEQLVRETIDELKSRATPVRSTFYLRQLLKSIAAETRDLDVRISDGDSDFELTGNPEHVRVIMLNLLRNAEQAGATAVDIELRPEPSGQSLLLAVHDNGSGIPEQHRERLFDSFAISTKPGGSGLGLYLVRRYTELLGGQVRVDVSKLGGALFLLRFPGRVSIGEYHHVVRGMAATGI